jgi:hypothetical protein
MGFNNHHIILRDPLIKRSYNKYYNNKKQKELNTFRDRERSNEVKTNSPMCIQEQ